MPYLRIWGRIGYPVVFFTTFVVSNAYECVIQVIIGKRAAFGRTVDFRVDLLPDLLITANYRREAADTRSREVIMKIYEQTGMLNKKVLVTGGAGFIGSHLCKRLLDDQCEVICLDNYFTGSKENILPLMSNPLFEPVRHDIIYPYNAEVDEIYNFACPASPVHYQFNPIQTVKVSVMGAINVLESAKLTGAKVLQASTSEVYGDPHVHPQPEGYWGNVNPIGIRSCYDEGKRCAETLFMDYNRQSNVAIKIIRIFNTYGPNMHPNDGRVVSNFIVQALMGEDLTIYGTGGQTRSFQYVTDLVEGVIKMMESPDDFIGPVNLGNPSEFTILELAETILQLTHSRSRLRFEPLPADDPTQRKPDITLAKKNLDWIPQVSLEEGLKETIRYFKLLLNA